MIVRSVVNYVAEGLGNNTTIGSSKFLHTVILKIIKYKYFKQSTRINQSILYELKSSITKTKINHRININCDSPFNHIRSLSCLFSFFNKKWSKIWLLKLKLATQIFKWHLYCYIFLSRVCDEGAEKSIATTKTCCKLIIAFTQTKYSLFYVNSVPYQTGIIILRKSAHIISYVRVLQ